MYYDIYYVDNNIMQFIVYSSPSPGVVFCGISHIMYRPHPPPVSPPCSCSFLAAVYVYVFLCMYVIII